MEKQKEFKEENIEENIREVEMAKKKKQDKADLIFLQILKWLYLALGLAFAVWLIIRLY